MSTVLIIGATRGFGLALLKRYASNPSTTVYGTSRSSAPSEPSGANIKWIPSIDLLSPTCGERLRDFLVPLKVQISTTIVAAGYFSTETLSDPSWENQQKMYTISAIAPSIIVSSLTKASLIPSSSSPQSSPPTCSKIILISSESGSITLRHPQEGGGNYGHHASKAASNMLTRLLALDLADDKIAVGCVHPSFMRTEMTRGVGFDQYWDAGGALPPEEAAEIVASWVDEEFGLDRSGQYWAPRGTRDIGTWEPVMGEGQAVEGPVQLPW